MVDDECNVMNDEAAFRGRCYTRIDASSTSVASVHRCLSLLSLNKAWPIPSTAIPRDQSCQSSHRITNLADVCEIADLAYFTSGSDVQQLYADAAPVIYASMRVAAAAGSGLVNLHLHCVVDGVST